MADEASCSVIPTATLFSTVVETAYVSTLVNTVSLVNATSISVFVDTVSTTMNGSTSVDQITRTIPITQTTSLPMIVTSNSAVTETKFLAFTTLSSTSCPQTPTPTYSTATSSSLTENSVSTRGDLSSFSSLIVPSTSSSSSSSSSSTSSSSFARRITSGVNAIATNVKVTSKSNTNAHQSTSYRTVYYTSTVTNNGVASTQQFSSQTAVTVGLASNTAAITGGIVGGIVVVVLAAVALCLLLRRKRKLSSQEFSGKDIFQPGHHSEKDSSSVIDASSDDAGPTTLNPDPSDEATLWNTESIASPFGSYCDGGTARADREGYVEDNHTGRVVSGYLPTVGEENFKNNPADLYMREDLAYSTPVPLATPLSSNSHYSSHSLHSLQSPPSPHSIRSLRSFHSQHSHQSPQSYFPQSPPLIGQRRISQYSVSSTHSQIEYLPGPTVSIGHPSWTPTYAGLPSSPSSVQHLIRPDSESSSWFPEQQRSQESILKEAEGNFRTIRCTRRSDVIEEEIEAPPRYI